MTIKEVKYNIYSVGAIDWDRRLFDSLIPLPDGTSYNSYLIKGSERTALVDTVDPTMSDVLMNHLSELGVRRIDYVVANHAEQDHSGSIPRVLEKYPEAQVVCTPKCKGMLIDLLMIPEAKFITANDKETISLGDRTLEFIHAPWVHWPETMLTYLREDKILFPCDFFGSHLATTDLYVRDGGRVYEAAKRYYAEIMMPFRTSIQKNLEKIKGYPIDIIAPSHGPMHDKPEFILKAYHSWAFDEPKNIVVLPYISMHGSTRRMVEYCVGALAERGVTVKQFDLAVTDIGKLAMALVDAATVVIGTPTVLAGPHPNVAYAAVLANALRPNLKFISIIGSYSWGGKAVEQLAAMIPNLKVEILEPVLSKGFPKEADLKALDNLADVIAQKHKENGFN
ncbi:MAG: MBL fold hydrolase [Chloroflexi bacterium CG07_land_8_20_14_0_80_51_10]|nr:MAG: MBL fold hydrolase [Chloroflexi bacterium CG07_land_8_20_14_0_80_51_10]